MRKPSGTRQRARPAPVRGAKTHYELLGVRTDASAQTIAQAYRRRLEQLARHRQDAGASEEVLARTEEAIERAYRVLRDSRPRRAYDETLSATSSVPPSDAPSAREGGDAAPSTPTPRKGPARGEGAWGEARPGTRGGERATDDAVTGGLRYKRRNPWGVWLLGVVTLWIYVPMWHYMINRELRDDGIPVEPAVSLMAVILGWIVIVPPFVSQYRTADRIRQAQERAGAAERIIPWAALLLWLVNLIGPVAPVYYQSQLNKVWDAEEARGAPVAAA